MEHKELAKRFYAAIENAKKDLATEAEVHLVIITGDITDTGISKEYNEAELFLKSLSEELKLDNVYFIFVPGNHDICWYDSQKAELEQRKCGFDEDELKRRIDLYKIGEFKEFLARFYCKEPAKIGKMLGRDAFIYDFSDIKLSVAALNSCESESHRDRDHRGEISSHQVQIVMNIWKAKDYQGWIKIAAIHHNLKPIGDEERIKWIAYLEAQQEKGKLAAEDVRKQESDIMGLEGKDYLETLARECQIQLILHGHQHLSKEDGVPRRNGNGYIDILSAGSFGLDTSKLPKDQRNSIRLILLDIKDEKLSSTIRIYDPLAQAEGFVVKGNFVPDTSNPKIYEQHLLLPTNYKLKSEGPEETEPEKKDIPQKQAATVSHFTDYGENIQNFIDDYLGGPGKPVPFGGRESDLKALDNWLDNPEASPYLLFATPAGRGKSALLVRWKQQLSSRKDIAVVFVPISIRYSTNLASVVFTALTAQLAKLNGDPPLDPNTPISILQGIMMTYLAHPLSDGRKLLVILDGLDEAADWSTGPHLFPSNPTKGLRIVVSARFLAGDFDALPWLRKLGWDKVGISSTPKLENLSMDGIADVLLQMGFPLADLSRNIDIVQELFRLSEGDPLLVHLYVEDLWRRGDKAARLRPEDLKAISPGLEGYFDSLARLSKNSLGQAIQRKRK